LQRTSRKTFFEYVKLETRAKTTVGALLDDNDVLVCDDKEMGELLNTFLLLFTREYQNDLPSIKKIFCGSNSEKLCTLVISPDMVKARLVKLRMNKAPGVDLVGTRMLTELADEISYIVAELFNKSLCSGDVLQDCKLASVTPISKKERNQVQQIINQLV